MLPDALRKRVEIAILVGGYPINSMHSTRVYFNSIGSILPDILRHGNGLSALLLLTLAAKTRSMESRLKAASWKRIVCAAIINTRGKM